MDWVTSEPPINESIEVECDDGEVRQGALKPNGSFGMGNNAQTAAARSKQLYTINGDKAFAVIRWRYI